MRIDLGNKLRETDELGGAKPSNARTQTNAPVKTELGDDRAELSPDQVRVQLLASRVNDLSDVRQEKVTALELAIRQGQYHVTPEQTAQAMLDEIRSAA